MLKKGLIRRKLVFGLAIVLIMIDIAGLHLPKVYASESGTVTATALNVRAGASTTSATYGCIFKGEKVTILEKSGAWYKVNATVGGVSRTGYVHSDYISTGGNSSGNTSGQGVVNVDALNVRSGASTGHSTYGCISKGTVVTIIGTSGSWYQVKTTVGGREVTGYVFAEYITKKTDSSDPNPSTPASGTGTVTASALNVRASASTSAAIYGSIYKGDKVTILESTGSWYKVTATINGASKTGYVHSDYISVSGGGDSGNGGQTTETTGTGTVNVSALNVRSEASTSSQVLGVITMGTTVNIIGTSGVWYKVTVTINGASVTGYVHSDYITKGSSGGSGGGTETPADNNYEKGTVIDGPLNIRESASTSSNVLGVLSIGTEIKIIESLDSWYKIQASQGGRMITGYVYAIYIRKDNNGSGSGGSGNPSDASFEASIAGFPESYKPYLRSLHEKYPEWEFKPINTGLNWNDVIAQESVVKINTYQTNINSGTAFSYLSTDSGAYNWATDKYTVCDGSNWYSASKELISYYMDPRNFLTESQIFQFESLAYDSSQTSAVVSSILNGTFMSGNYTYTENGKSVTKSYTDTFMEAGKNAKVSPYFLAARSRQEIGVTKSASVTGTHATYPGYYNYFNIGASDGSNAIANGLYYASGSGGKYTTYSRPWNTPYKSIIGGAQFLGESYINVGQNTLYFQKFNVVYKNALYRHQYMTNVQAASSEASTVYSAYSRYGILKGKIAFYIPVYNNMPASASAMPAKKGNPNSYISSMTVKSNAGGNLLLTPTFNYKTTSYDIIVNNSVSSISVGATSVSQYAQGISGTGTHQLAVGKNTITVTCTAGDGTKTTYTLNVTRLSK